MKESKRERSPLYRKILFGFTSDPITVWAGVILLRLYFEWIKLRAELNEALVGLVKRSNNQISSVDVLLSWFYGLVWEQSDSSILAAIEAIGCWASCWGSSD